MKQKTRQPFPISNDGARAGLQVKQMLEGRNLEIVLKAYKYIHSWHLDSTNIVVTTIPMIHIGTQQYYSEVSRIIDNLNVLLEEGVPIKLDSEVGTYSRLANKVGLVTQMCSLAIPNDIERINIDIEKETLKSELSKVAIKERIGLRLFKYVVYFIPKEKLLSYMRAAFTCSEEASIKLIDPSNHYAYKHNKTPLDILITTTRNNYINENIRTIIKQNINRDYRYDIGILLGEEHMPTVYNALKELGFKWRMEKKLVAFSL